MFKLHILNKKENDKFSLIAADSNSIVKSHQKKMSLIKSEESVISPEDCCSAALMTDRRS